MRMFSRTCTFLLCPLLAIAAARQWNDVWVLLALLVVCAASFCGILGQWRDSGLTSAESPTTLDLRP